MFLCPMQGFNKMYNAVMLRVLCEFEIGMLKNWVPRGIDGRRGEDATAG